MKNAGKARSYGLYRHLRTSKEIIENLLNYSRKTKNKGRGASSEITEKTPLPLWAYYRTDQAICQPIL